MNPKLILVLALVGGAFATEDAAAQASAEGEKIEQQTTEALNAAARRATPCGVCSHRRGVDRPG